MPPDPLKEKQQMQTISWVISHAHLALCQAPEGKEKKLWARLPTCIGLGLHWDRVRCVRARPPIGAKGTLATYFSLIPPNDEDRTLLP